MFGGRFLYHPVQQQCVHHYTRLREFGGYFPRTPEKGGGEERGGGGRERKREREGEGEREREREREKERERERKKETDRKKKRERDLKREGGVVCALSTCSLLSDL